MVLALVASGWQMRRRCLQLLSFGLLQVVSGLDSSHDAESSSLEADAIAGGSRLLRREASRQDSRNQEELWENVIWCYYDYPNGPTPFVKLNMETWKTHAPNTRVVMVNDSNIKDLIPDLPQEYFMLPYASAKSDLLRAALLYHHGGLYMDTDFLVNKPLIEVFSKLNENDIVTYSDDEHKPSGECGRWFSSNFMAGRKHNGFSRTWWENLKRKLTAVCSPGMFPKEKVCCHVEGEIHDKCHIPWASLEHMKQPFEAAGALLDVSSSSSLLEISASTSSSSGDGGALASNAEQAAMAKISILAPEFINELPKGLRLFCFQGDQGMTPHINGEVYWQPWLSDGRTGSAGQQELYDTRFDCKANQQDLSCKKGNWGPSDRTLNNFFGRIAYHLFFSTGQRAAKTKEDVFDKSWLVSDMYKRSLGHSTGEVLLQKEDKTAKEKEAEEEENRLGYQNTIWAFYEYPNGPSPFVQLNLETWRRHAPEMRLNLVNDSNVRKFIPDLPEEYFRLGYSSAKSDCLRAGLLYHHGGLYMDTDFLMMGSMKDIIAKLEDHDVVSYSDNTGVPSGKCGPDRFSSNFMSGRKGNPLSKIWWSNIKAKLTFPCKKQDYNREWAKLCCHFENETKADLKDRNCHVPWASIEHMKDPVGVYSALELGSAKTNSLLESNARVDKKDKAASDVAVVNYADSSNEAIMEARRKVSVLVPEFIDSLPKDVRVYCFAGNESLVPHLNGEVFWQPWASGKTASRVEAYPKERILYEHRFRCVQDGLALNCGTGNWGPEVRLMHNFFGRHAYHLFFTTTNKWADTKMDVLNMDWLLSAMYRLSLGLD